MRRIWLAVRAFFLVLCSSAAARAVAEAIARRRDEPPPRPSPLPETKPTPPPKLLPRATRSEAITLLAALQREARLVDFLQEPLEGYTDAQIGAAARQVHRDCSKLLERLLALRPIVAQEEGSPLEVPAGFDAGRWRLVGSVAGEPPYRGRLVHHGWEATRCQLPAWTGTESSARVVAPVEVEIEKSGEQPLAASS
ncbi:MAG: DUF2760 domain-containing protein [Thermoguttaceae bacterium]|jgi:hypothetical protein